MGIEETSFAWHETLGLPATAAADADTARLAMRRLALRYHPDQGGTELQMTRINGAYAEGTTPSANRPLVEDRRPPRSRPHHRQTPRTAPSPQR
jgi:hypothetical protein